MRGRAALLLFGALSACDDGSGIGDVMGGVAFFPGEVDFGAVPIQQTFEVNATLRASTLVGEVVREARFDNPAFVARTRDGGTLRGSRIPSGGLLDVRVIFAPSEAGVVSTALLADIKGFEARLDVRADAFAEAPADPVAEPSTLAFGDVELGRTAVLRFIVRNRGARPTRLLEVRPSSGAASAPFAVTAPAGGTLLPSRSIAGLGQDALELELRFTPRALGVFDQRMVLIFEDGRSTELAATGTAVPEGTLACQPRAVDFGQVVRGEMSARSIRCAVTGGAFTLTAVKFGDGSSPLFSLRNVPSTQAPDGRLDFEIDFDSRALAGTYDGTVEIVSGSGSVTRASVRAEVIAAPPNDTDVRVTLDWSSGATDLDLHFVRSQGRPFSAEDDCYYARKTQDWGALSASMDNPFLDRDAMAGYGPEEMNLVSAGEDVFDVYVHFYNFSGARPPTTDAEVTVLVRNVEVARVRQAMDVCGVTWHAGQLRLRPTPTFTADSTRMNDYVPYAGLRCR